LIERQRTEEADVGVTDRGEGLGRQLVAIDVGYPGVVAAAREVAAIRGENEAFGHRIPHLEGVRWHGLALGERIRTQYLHACHVWGARVRTGSRYRYRCQGTVGRETQI